MSQSLENQAQESAPIAELEALLGFHFQDKDLLLRALTHRSFVNDHEGQGACHNESLEFLGDSVLGFLISSRIFQHYPELTEGELSKIKAYLVSATNLVQLAEKIRLGEYLRLSHGEEKSGGSVYDGGAPPTKPGSTKSSPVRRSPRGRACRSWSGIWTAGSRR